MKYFISLLILIATSATFVLYDKYNPTEENVDFSFKVKIFKDDNINQLKYIAMVENVHNIQDLQNIRKHYSTNDYSIAKKLSRNTFEISLKAQKQYHILSFLHEDSYIYPRLVLVRINNLDDDFFVDFIVTDYEQRMYFPEFADYKSRSTSKREPVAISSEGGVDYLSGTNIEVITLKEKSN